MSDKYFVDTNILIYAHDPAMGLKHRRGLKLIEDQCQSGRGVLSTQVLQEFCINVRRKATHPSHLRRSAYLSVITAHGRWFRTRQNLF